jgi:hypothetical protein
MCDRRILGDRRADRRIREGLEAALIVEIIAWFAYAVDSPPLVRSGSDG